MNQLEALASLVVIGSAQEFLVEPKLKTPTVVFHGITRHCKDMLKGSIFADHISQVTGAHAECVEIDAPFDDPTLASYNSIFNNFNHYTQAACDAVSANPHFNSTEFNLVGISQGSLVARNLVENCPHLKVRNLWTIGGPHRGVHAFPHCESGTWCDTLGFIIDNYDYDTEIQDKVNPAAYWRDPANLDDYMAKSIFLPYVNNEKDFK